MHSKKILVVLVLLNLFFVVPLPFFLSVEGDAVLAAASIVLFAVLVLLADVVILLSYFFRSRNIHIRVISLILAGTSGLIIYSLLPVALTALSFQLQQNAQARLSKMMLSKNDAITLISDCQVKHVFGPSPYHDNLLLWVKDDSPMGYTSRPVAIEYWEDIQQTTLAAMEKCPDLRIED